MRPTIFCAALLVLGCSSSSEDKGGPCALRKGSYTFSLTARDGDCGRIPDQVVTVEQASDEPGKSGPVAAPCTGTTEIAKDNCSSTIVDYVCPEANTGGTSKLNGKVNWSRDGASGHGIVSATAYNSRGAVLCSGSYDANYQKI